MKKSVLPVLVANLFLPIFAQAASPIASITKEWTYAHSATGVVGQASEISAYDSITNTIWVAGAKGVDVLNATNGSLVQHISTAAFGNINSVAIKNGIAAFALEDASNRANAGVVKLFDTSSRSLLSGVNSITVGALPDMLTFTADGSKLLVANEATPNFIEGTTVNDYGSRVGTTTPRNYGASPNDPVGSVSIIDMSTRTVVATPTFNGVTTTGTHIRTNTGMDFEPEYIAVDAYTNKAFVTLQEANAVAILDLSTNTFEKVVGLGAKDFNLPGNTLDPLNNGTVSFINANVKGLYMPDAIASYRANGNTYMVMANEGDFREDNADRSAAGSTPFNATSPLNNLRISNTDSSAGDLYVAGARSFSIRDANGVLVYDSGDILDKEAFARGIYDDGRSRDKGVEPEGVELFTLKGRTIAAVGLERTTKSAVALFDITDPNAVSFLDMIVTDGDVSPEGLDAFEYAGKTYLTIANEVSNTTTLYSIAAVPEPEQYALMLVGLACLLVQRKKNLNTK